MGATLAKIDSPAANAFVYERMHGNTWIGLNDRFKEGQFVWPNGAKPRYTNWSPSEPNNVGAKGEDCAVIYSHNGKWNDYNCDTTYQANYACSTTKSTTSPLTYKKITKGCVNGMNIVRYADKSVSECTLLCNANPKCKAFEYGVAYGGKRGNYKARDCQLQSSANAANCNGADWNLDLYIKRCDETLAGVKGAGYRGCQTRTKSGRECMKWTVQSPHKHVNTPAKKPNMGLGDHNYCRNPDGHKTLWCYTTDKNKRWEECAPLTGVMPNFRCAGHHNAKSLCCGQTGGKFDPKYNCPSNFPVCKGFVQGRKWGQCYAGRPTYKFVKTGDCTSNGMDFIRTFQECSKAGRSLGIVRGMYGPSGNRQKYCGTWGGSRFLHFNSQTSGKIGNYYILQKVSRRQPNAWQICKSKRKRTAHKPPPVTALSYKKLTKGCVSGMNIVRHADKSVGECEQLCNA